MKQKEKLDLTKDSLRDYRLSLLFSFIFTNYEIITRNLRIF